VVLIQSEPFHSQLNDFLLSAFGFWTDFVFLFLIPFHLEFLVNIKLGFLFLIFWLFLLSERFLEFFSLSCAGIFELHFFVFWTMNILVYLFCFCFFSRVKDFYFSFLVIYGLANCFDPYKCSYQYSYFVFWQEFTRPCFKLFYFITRAKKGTRRFFTVLHTLCALHTWIFSASPKNSNFNQLVSFITLLFLSNKKFERGRLIPTGGPKSPQISQNFRVFCPVATYPHYNFQFLLIMGSGRLAAVGFLVLDLFLLSFVLDFSGCLRLAVLEFWSPRLRHVAC